MSLILREMVFDEDVVIEDKSILLKMLRIK